VRRLAVVLGALACAVCAASARADTGTSFHDRLVSEVEQGLVAANQRWAWKGWYQDFHGVPGWTSVWDTEQLFQAYVGLNQASPSLRNRNRVLWFAAKSEAGYYNAGLGQGIGGFATGYDDKGEQNDQWFDDNGWLGLSFMDAWRVTKQKRFLDDAEIAFRYLYQAGWDPIGGGIWWNTQHSVKAAESVNTAALLAVELYEAHAGAAYLTSAQRLIEWADDNLLDQDSGLYLNHPLNGVVVSYNQSPMLDAFVRLCRDVQQYCGRVKPLTSAILEDFGGDLDQPPQYDATFLRYLMDVYEITQDQRLYAVASRNAQRIERNSVDADGFYLKAWDGSMSGIRPGLISVDGAALEALAWTAAEAPDS
jgi:Glycosyl hydrolase family 76